MEFITLFEDFMDQLTIYERFKYLYDKIKIWH